MATAPWATSDEKRDAESSATAFSLTQATTTTTRRNLEERLPPIQRDNSTSGSAIPSVLGEINSSTCRETSHKPTRRSAPEAIHIYAQSICISFPHIVRVTSYSPIIDAFAFLFYAFSPVISPTSQTIWIACHTSSPSAPRCPIS
jgi:hypothetical protein